MRLSILTLTLLFAPALALAQELTPDAGTDALVAGIIQAIQAGNVGLAVVVALMLVVALIRKVLAPKVAFLAGDAGGTVLNFVTVLLVMVAGPVSAGAALTLGVVKTAALTAFATSGGWTALKRLVLNPLLPRITPVIDEKVGAIPVVGLVLKPIVRFLLGKYLGAPAPAAAPAPELATSTSTLQASKPPKIVAYPDRQSEPYDPSRTQG